MDAVHIAAAELAAHRGDACLEASALGSCVAVAALDPTTGVGGIAHVMLPGRPLRARSDDDMAAQYAEPAVELLLERLTALGSAPGAICACLVGGADVLGDGSEGPGEATCRSVEDALAERGVPIVARDLDGRERRSCTLDVATGRVSYTVGDSVPRRLWEPPA